MKPVTVYNDAKLLEATILERAEAETNILLPLIRYRDTLEKLKEEFSFVDFLDEMVGLDEDNDGSIYLTFRERQNIRDCFIQGLNNYRAFNVDKQVTADRVDVVPMNRNS